MMTDEEEKFAVGPENQSQCKSFFLSKESQSMALMSMKKEEEGEYHLGASAMSVKNGNLKAIVVSGLGTVSKELPSTLEKTTADVQHQLRNEIRKFGRKYERIFKLLDGIQGPLEVKKKMVEFAIKEAARFKKRHLIHQLNNKLEELNSEHILNNDQQTTSL